MASVTQESVIDALKAVVDPDTGRDVVSSGIVSGVIVKDGNVGFALEVSPEDGAAKEPLRKVCEAAVENIPGVLSVTAVLTAESKEPPPPRQQAQQTKPEIPGVHAIVAVASGKGGVGKSTTTVNLATALALQGLRIGVLDCDVYGPSIPRMLKLSGKPRSDDGKTLLPMENYGIKCMSIGFLVEEDTPMIWRGPMVMSALEQMMRDVHWGELDMLLCDLPPGTGDAQLTMAQRVPMTGAVVVSTPQDIALLDVKRGINMFHQVNVPVFGVIENMSYFQCPKCGERTDVFNHGGAHRMADELGADFLGEIPLDMAIRETSDAGTPITIAQPDSAHAAAYHEIARRLIDKIASAAAGGARSAPRIVMM